MLAIQYRHQIGHFTVICHLRKIESRTIKVYDGYRTVVIHQEILRANVAVSNVCIVDALQDEKKC